MERRKLENIYPFLSQALHNMPAARDISIAAAERMTLTFRENDGHVVEALVDVE